MATQTNRSMISETSICNQALSWIGGNQIDSLEEPSTEATWCRNNYPFLRDAVLEERQWTFATVRAISEVAETPIWGTGLYAHPVPLDWLGVFRVYRDQNGNRANWHREGRDVIADAAKVYMWGTLRVTDTGFFTTMFVQALAARIAADLAIAFSQSRQLQADMWALYERKLDDAAARDGQQGRNEVIEQTVLTSARINDGSRLVR
jgi:hypothetical protein